MTARQSRPTEVEPEIERIDHPRLPPDHRGRCTACDYRAHPLAFHHSWEWDRMTEKEREQARRRRERFESKMVEYQHSATHLAEQREP